MSRIGRAPVELPGGVNVELSDRSVKVTGPRGELTVPVGRGVRVEQEDGNLVVRRNSDAPPDRAMHGLTCRPVARRASLFGSRPMPQN